MDALRPTDRHAPTVPLLAPEEAADGDRAAVASGATWAGLMERAAGHLARGVVELAGHGYGLRIALVCGRGNNGGDGWAAAGRLSDFGALARVVAVDGLDAEMSDEADRNRRVFLDRGGRATGPEGLEAALAWCDVAVDCLLGTGATGAPRGAVGEAVAALCSERRPASVVACDIPTGVRGSDGSVPGEAVRADLTVTFGALKRGLLLHPGAEHAGRVVVGELGPHYAPPEPAWSALTAAGALPPALAPDADKLRRGRVLIVAGSRGMAGAAILCARGALAAGAGLLSVAVPRSVQDVVASAVPPALTLGVPDDEDGRVAAEAAKIVAEQAERSDAVLAGPGLRPTPATRAVVDALLQAAPRLVLDADALNVYRGEGGDLAEHAGVLVLTPHVREFARISGASEDGSAAWRERTRLVPALAADLDATVVMKGPGTLTAAPDGRVLVNPTGGPALGAGGTGDVLGGMIAALLAGADDPLIAAARGVWLHGLAGHLAGTGGRTSSGEVAEVVPDALAVAGDLARRRPGWPFDGPGWRADRAPWDGEGGA